MLSITWKEPRVGDGWSIHDTECGKYRIDYSDTLFTPRRMTERKTDYGVERTWLYMGDFPTLDAAMAAINNYHCLTHNLTLRKVSNASGSCSTTDATA